MIDSLALKTYNNTSYTLSRLITNEFSSSFSASSQLFDATIRRHIYAIYGLVRIADEIVDSYGGTYAEEMLGDLYEDIQRALKCRYSANPIVHAYCLTAVEFSIDNRLLVAFFDSMALDLVPQNYTDALYETYIYGSAEVIGLMCLSVFIEGDSKRYTELESGARALGSAYQKVNFLRDLKADFEQLGRVYFPGVTYEQFDEAAKAAIIADIETDFSTAQATIINLPASSRLAVQTSFEYYTALLERLQTASVEDIKQHRLSVPTSKKLSIIARARLKKIGRKA